MYLRSHVKSWKYFSNLSFFIVLILISYSCGTGKSINDFFGIMMNPLEEKNFRIISFDELQGIRYQSAPDMDPDISAWAEIGVENIHIKIVNNSQRSIKLDYFTDQFVIITENKKYNIHKGTRNDYFYGNSLSPGSDAEILLRIPSDFAEDFTKRGEARFGKDIMSDYSKNWSDYSILKENIEFIVVRLSDVVIVLKRVP